MLSSFVLGPSVDVDCAGVAAFGPVGGSFAAFAGVEAASELACSVGLLSSLLSEAVATAFAESSGTASAPLSALDAFASSRSAPRD